VRGYALHIRNKFRANTSTVVHSYVTNKFYVQDHQIKHDIEFGIGLFFKEAETVQLSLGL